ncbi:hypothetical protein HGRIS_012631 [Hohenbuehelia grisea]|uniref:Vacuolar membrane-associated protein IML1 n=1 Tax=Hohenbuehelia grisea TaxID=104357 RepID=A0ABR3IT60_9AGAR
MPSSSYRQSTDKRSTEKRSLASHRGQFPGVNIPPIEESPRRIMMELPPEGPNDHGLSVTTSTYVASSPSQSSLRSLITSRTQSTTGTETPGQRSRDSSTVRSSLTSKLTPSWLFSPFRNRPLEPTVSISSVRLEKSPSVNQSNPLPQAALPIRPNGSSKSTSSAQPPIPVSIRNTPTTRSFAARTLEEDSVLSYRTVHARRSPMNTPPRDDNGFPKRRGSTMSHLNTPLSSSSGNRSNPSRPQLLVPLAQASLARRWQHMFPEVIYKHKIKWKSLVTPGCLPLSVEYLPPAFELEKLYDMFSYDFVVDLREMHPFLVKVPETTSGGDEQRRAWALAVIRGMAAVRLVQGFQFILRPPMGIGLSTKPIRRSSTLIMEEDMTPIPLGAAEILHSLTHPIYLSMSNEIHRIAYTGETIQVNRYVRRMPSIPEFNYKCLIWPKLGEGYTEHETMFSCKGLENYGWNRLDMLVAGYEHQIDESLRYWRTRFIVIPTAEPPSLNIGPSGEALSDEETRILGIEKLAEIFSKLRWPSPDEKKNGPPPPVRFLPTTLGPAMSVLDEALMAQLDDIHAAGPLRKKMKSEREVGDMPLPSIVKAMREDEGVPIKNYQWHGTRYPDSFTGSDFVSWLVREFRDVSSRTQGEEIGGRLMDQGLLEHCRGHHGFLDGHYFYRLKGEFAVPSTPRGWFKSKPTTENSGYYPSSGPKRTNLKTHKKRLILSQTITMNIDPHKRSDQAEAVILHHDIIHNPATVFHFELQWIGTTARCIEDQLRQWSRVIEKYGLKLVEAYVTQISDIRERNAFQSCFPIKLAIPPPIVTHLAQRVPEHTQTAHYFEYAILRRFGFILDIEASDLYPDTVDVVYSYRRSPYKYSQFVHRSGVAFIQVLGGSQGFLFLTNRLMGPGRMGTTMKSKEHRPAAAAEEIRIKLHNFCCDPVALNGFYDEEIALINMANTTAPEEPPPLHI